MMKTLLLLTLATITTALSAQFSLYYEGEKLTNGADLALVLKGDTIDQYAELETQLQVKNESGQNISLKVRRTILQQGTGVYYVCTPNACYAGSEDEVWEEPNPFSLAPGEMSSENELSGHISYNWVTEERVFGNWSVKFAVFNVDNPSEEFYVTAHYEVFQVYKFRFFHNGIQLDNGVELPVVVVGDTLDDGSELVSHFQLKNETDQTLSLKLKRTLLQHGTGIYYVCTPNACYPGSHDEIWEEQNPFTLAPGEMTNEEELSGHLAYDLQNQEPIFGTWSVEISVFHSEKPYEILSVTANYEVIPLSVSELAAKSFSAAYPNPGHDLVSFDYNLDKNIRSASIRIQNILGSVVTDQIIDNRVGTKTIDVSGLLHGVYFASIIIDGKLARTEKLIVQ